MRTLKISKKLIACLAGTTYQSIWRRLSDKKNQNADITASHSVNITVARDILYNYIAKKHMPRKRIQTFFNFKGGTGKTTLTYNISYMFYLYGYKVLVIDCDPQGHLTRSVCGNYIEQPSYYDVVTDQRSILDVIRTVHDGYDIIPSSIKLTFFDSNIQNRVNREKILLKDLEKIKENYDFIFIDVNPSINQMNRNALIASDTVNIVSEAQPYSFYGMEILLQEFKQLAEVSTNNVIDYRIILNKVEPRSTINISIANALRDTPGLENHLIESVVRKSEDFNFSAKEGIPVVCLNSKNSNNAKTDIIEIAKEMLLRSTINVLDNSDEA